MKKTMVFVYVLAALAGLWAGFFTARAVFADKTEENRTSATEKTENGEAVLHAARIEEHPASAYDPGVRADADVLTANWYPDTESVHTDLLYAKRSAQKRQVENVYEEIKNSLTALGSLSNYLKYKENLSVTVGDTVYGAYTAEGTPSIGGGKGYDRIVTTGDYVVRTYAELVEACIKAGEGEVIFIPSDVTIDVTMESKPDNSGGCYIVLHRGVTLASDRGFVREDGSVSTGAKICGYGFGKTNLSSGFIYCNPYARITGLVIEGPDPMKHVEHHTRCYRFDGSFDHTMYYKLPMPRGIEVNGKNVEIDNCEISGFSSVAIAASSEEIHVHHNYIHHNQIKGLGYGVAFGGGGLIEYNLFNFNRHSIAGSGRSNQYYVARYNVDMGDSLSHVFDMHGGADRGDGTNIAGKYIEMYNNTFLSDSNPYHRRGVPVEYQIFYHNVVKNEKGYYNFSRLVGEKMTLYDNVFGIETKKVLK